MYICHNQPSFHWLLYCEGMSYGTFSSTRESSTFFVFQARRTVFFCFSFWKSHSLDLEIPRKPIQWVKDPKKACDLILMRFHRLIFTRWRQKAKTAHVYGVNVFFRKVMIIILAHFMHEIKSSGLMYSLSNQQEVQFRFLGNRPPTPPLSQHLPWMRTKC